jgi:hypothetical protein
VPGGPVRFTLADGEMLSVPETDLQHVYELLWQLALTPGAISLAAVIRGVSRPEVRYGAPIDLTAQQSAALRKAMALLHTNASE